VRRLAEALMTPNTAVKRMDLSCNQMLGVSGKERLSELLLDNLNCVEDLAMMGCDLYGTMFSRCPCLPAAARPASAPR
jgi:hypothetical protein